MKQIIFIPGFGGSATLERQRKQIASWSVPNEIEAFFFEPSWHSGEELEPKLDRLIEFFDKHIRDEAEIYGASAGGPLTISLFELRSDKISRMKLVCPKLKGHETIGQKFINKSPAILPAVINSEKVIQIMTHHQRQKITTYRPLYEFVVPLKDMKIQGADNKLLPFFGHVSTIAIAMIFILKP